MDTAGSAPAYPKQQAGCIFADHTPAQGSLYAHGKPEVVLSVKIPFYSGESGDLEKVGNLQTIMQRPLQSGD